MIRQTPRRNVEQRFSQNISLSTTGRSDIKHWLEICDLCERYNMMRLKWRNDRRLAFKRRPFYGLEAVAVVVSQSECICSLRGGGWAGGKML